MAQFPPGLERRSGQRIPLLLASVLFLGAAAPIGGSCIPSDPNFIPGVSEEPFPVGSVANTGAPKQPQRWEHFDRLDRFDVLSASFRSRGHGTGDWEAELRGSPGAGDHLDGLVPGRQMPVGTVLYQRHEQRQVGAEIGAFAMEKRPAGYFPGGGDWEYVILDREGRIEARGKLAPCARCHAEAPTDFVFPRLVSDFDAGP